MRVKQQTPARRVTNPVCLRRQLGQLVRDGTGSGRVRAAPIPIVGAAFPWFCHA
jgi:hypothetical protein